MMRTIEILIVIIIIFGAFATASFYAVLPSPRQVSPVNLRRLALTTLEMLDSNYDLSKGTFDFNGTHWGVLWSDLQVALSASLPPGVLYNLTVYDVNGTASGSELYNHLGSISNAESLGVASDASSYMVASSNVSFAFTPERIG